MLDRRELAVFDQSAIFHRWKHTCHYARHPQVFSEPFQTHSVNAEENVLVRREKKETGGGSNGYGFISALTEVGKK